ncbi:16S rRNA (guanine(966)-N(2))-methyltransferase RsmD [uncultured Secundilactobacillus sp.]|uniref:16S rRNA (guanine(966)-N(2))-methyltransferase RsmD n=1 Tax=uncultured Secundilactobacillus sp. TaxID=2813935 RepID=UPI00258B9C53|nr:16S rRNA (guanine(966)-N(2))-methyltransferase RsmD [uncultured Secundilactobacillus sp.]
MRVVAGEYGGRRLRAVPGMKTRPTTDKVKEAIFNIIGPYFNGGRSLDLFAGSGGLSIEGVSRGISAAVLIDRQAAAIKTIEQNIDVTKEPDKFTLIKGDADKVIQRLSEQGLTFDLVYFDPPYKAQKIASEIRQLQALNLLNQDCIIVCETNLEAAFENWVGAAHLVEQKEYGITRISIFHVEKES